MTEVSSKKPIPSIRLTKSDNEALAKSLVRYKYSKSTEYDEIKQQRLALIADIIANVISSEDRDKIDSLPRGWLPDVTSISVRFGDGYYSNYTSLDLSGGNFLNYHAKNVLNLDRDEDVSLSLPYMLYHGAFAVYGTIHHFTDRHTDISRRIEKFQNEIQSLYKKALGTISSVTTTKKLVEIWPEIEPFVRARWTDGNEKNAIKLPAIFIPTEELNNAFGLPVLETAE